MEYCESHVKLCEDVATIKETVLSIKEKQGSTKLLWGTILSIIVTIIIQIISFAFLYGQQSKQVVINTARIDALENIHPRSKDVR